MHVRTGIASLVPICVLLGCGAPHYRGLVGNDGDAAGGARPDSGDGLSRADAPASIDGPPLGAADAPMADVPSVASGDAGNDTSADIGTTSDGPPPQLTAFGATPHAGGTMFRVWAPRARKVFVVGQWTGAGPDGDELAEASGGVFAGNVAAARPGHTYQYVIQASDGTKVTRLDPRSRAATSSVGKSIIVDPTAYRWTTTNFKTPSLTDQVVYELHAGTFNDAPGGRPGGWKTAVEKLDHLAALGVNMLEVMPPAEFPGDFSWGYNSSLPFAPEGAYGSPDDLRTFIDQAHARGMGVVIDVVHNHWGPNDLPHWCFDGDCLGGGGSYFYTDARRETPWGPRPDYGRREVREYIQDNALAWLLEYRADGLRWDSTVNIRQANGVDLPDGWKVLQAANEAINKYAPDSLQIAEDLQGNDAITRSVATGGAGFDAQGDAAFFHPVNAAIIVPDDSGRSMIAVRDAINHKFNGLAHQRVIYTENHDEVANGRQRIPSMIAPNDAGGFFARKRSTLGAVVVMTAPGIPMLFMGQEFLEDKYFADTRPLDWTKTTTHAGVLALYRDLIALRRNRSGTTRGLRGGNVNVFHVNDTAKIIAYHRWQDGGVGDDVVVVANFANRAFASYEIGLPRGGTWKVRFNSDAKQYGDDFGDVGAADVTTINTARDGLPHTGTVALGKYSAVILSQ